MIMYIFARSTPNCRYAIFWKTEKYILAVMNDSLKQSYDNRELSIFAEDREKKSITHFQIFVVN